MTFRRVLLGEKANFHCYMIAVCAKVKCYSHSLWFYIPTLLAPLFLTKTDVSCLHMCSVLRVICMYLVRVWIGSLDCLSPL